MYRVKNTKLLQVQINKLEGKVGYHSAKSQISLKLFQISGQKSGRIAAIRRDWKEKNELSSQESEGKK